MKNNLKVYPLLCLIVIGTTSWFTGTHVAEIRSAEIVSNNNQQSINLSLRIDDLRYIIEKQIYVVVRVLDCKSEKAIGTIYPMLGGVKLDQFDEVRLPTRVFLSDAIVLTGQVRGTSLRYNGPLCVMLNGGSYFGGEITSNKITLVISETRN